MYINISINFFTFYRYIFEKKWNQSLVDLVPVALSKITKHKIIIFKILGNNKFFEIDQTFDSSYVNCIYLKLHANHYDSIFVVPSLEQTSTHKHQIQPLTISNHLQSKNENHLITFETDLFKASIVCEEDQNFNLKKDGFVVFLSHENANRLTINFYVDKKFICSTEHVSNSVFLSSHCQYM